MTKLFFFVLFFIVHLSESKEITVAIQKNYQNSLQKGLDIKMIASFAEKMKYTVNFVATNKTMSEILSEEEKDPKQFKTLHSFLTQS